MNQGFIKLPREFLQSRKWLNLNLISRTIFLILLEHAAYEKRTFNNLGKNIELNPGDICISRKRLLELCPKGITEKQVRVSIINLNRTNFCKKRAKERAKETDILTICDPIIYNQCFLENGQRKGQAKGQRRAKEGPIKEEGKECKEEEKEKIKKENFSEKKIEPIEELIQIRSNVKLKKDQIEELKKQHPEEKLEWCLDALNSWLEGKEEIKKYTAKMCFSKLMKGSWTSNKYEEEKSKGTVTKTYSANIYEIREKEAREYAQKICSSYTSPHYEVKVTDDGKALSFYSLTVGPIYTISFKDNGFKEQVKGIMDKRGFVQKVQPIQKQIASA